MKKFNIDDYGLETAMSFANKKEYNAFSKYLDSLGKTWYGGGKYTEQCLYDNYYKGNTGILFKQGLTVNVDNLTETMSRGYTILKYSDFDWCNLPTPQEWAEAHQLYVATDFDGEVWAFTAKPQRNDIGWGSSDMHWLDITDLVQPQDGKDCENSLCIPSSLQPKYEPYEKFNTDWIGKRILRDDCYREIIGTFDGKVATYNENTLELLSLEELFNDYKWAYDDTPCGEKVDEI